MTPPTGNQPKQGYFDEAATTWDENPHRRAVTEAIARAIRAMLPLNRDWRVLEYGCGTGTLSFLLAPAVREVVAADASPGMLEQVRRKLALYPGTRMTPLLLDLTCNPSPGDKFDLIVTAMTLHHVDDTERLLSSLGGMLPQGGRLVVADLCPEDGSFHEPRKVPHNGFAPDALANLVSQSLGRADCQWRIVHRVQKNDRGYDVFLLAAQTKTGSSDVSGIAEIH
ncbi:MAG TPA: class I SAM-dependent methyltransferase [Tepidisphaeraceae bacterium]|nr:class I SAM-dependent methyltransferase [Tepidisphaeraceae bacterium]